jgi:hypothetical protein
MLCQMRTRVGISRTLDGKILNHVIVDAVEASRRAKTSNYLKYTLACSEAYISTKTYTVSVALVDGGLQRQVNECAWMRSCRSVAINRRWAKIEK